MALRDHWTELALVVGALLPGLEIAEAAPGLTGALFLASGAAFVLAFLVHDGDQTGSVPTTLAALLLPAVIGAEVLGQLGAPMPVQEAYALLALSWTLAGVGLAKGWVSLPQLLGPRTTRALTLPWLLLMGACLNTAIDYFVAEVSLAEPGLALFLGLGVLPMLFALAVVAPAQLFDGDDEIGWGRWGLRYGLAIASAALSLVLFGALL